jgi:hypothetical protein
MKKNIASALLVGIIISTGSVFAQEEIVPIASSKTENKAPEIEPKPSTPKEMTREKWEIQKKEMEAKKQTVKQEAQTLRENTKEKIETQKTQIKDKKEEYKALTEEKKGQIKTQIEEVKKTREIKKAEIQEIRKENVQKRKEFVQKGLSEAISILESRANRIEASITTAGSKGISTAEATTRLTEARGHIAQAKTALSALQSNTVSTENGTAINTARSQAQSANTHIKAARESLVKSVQALKTALINAKDA